jgi:hypothetical protein
MAVAAVGVAIVWVRSVIGFSILAEIRAILRPFYDAKVGQSPMTIKKDCQFSAQGSCRPATVTCTNAKRYAMSQRRTVSV